MNCKKCKAKIENNEIYCPQCGIPTGVVKEKMSAFKTFSEVYRNYKANKNKHFSMSLFAFIYGIIPLVAAKFAVNEFLSDSHRIIVYAIYLLVSSLFVPFLLAPLCKNGEYYGTNSQTSEYKEALGYYPRLLLMSILFALYLIAFRVICQGDPILNLVHLVMIFYGIAIFMPVPYLIKSRDLGVWKALKVSYKSGLYSYRWQFFFMTILILLVNLPGFLFMFYAYKLTAYNESSAWITSAVLFVLSTAWSFIVFPFSWQLIKSLSHKVDENLGFEKDYS
jgi:hypothetical protein